MGDYEGITIAHSTINVLKTKCSLSQARNIKHSSLLSCLRGPLDNRMTVEMFLIIQNIFNNFILPKPTGWYLKHRPYICVGNLSGNAHDS